MSLFVTIFQFIRTFLLINRILSPALGGNIRFLCIFKVLNSPSLCLPPGAILVAHQCREGCGVKGAKRRSEPLTA